MPELQRIRKTFFFNDTATTEIYTLSLHDALPIYVDPRERRRRAPRVVERHAAGTVGGGRHRRAGPSSHGVVGRDRKSTRLNSSHANISYAVFCLKKKHNQHPILTSNTLYLYSSTF